MIEVKQQIVQQLLKKYTGPPEEFEFVKAELSKLSLPELQQYAQLKSSAIRAAEADDRILELQATRSADRAIHELKMSQAREPQRKAEDKRQLAEDRKTFVEACRQFHIGSTDANFGLIRSSLGPGFSAYQIGEAVRSGTLQVSPATPEEIQQWTRDAQEQRQQFLRSADVETLRSVIRNEAESRRAQAQHDEDQRQLAARQAKDEAYGFPTLPEINAATGEKLTSAYFIKLSNTDLQQFKNYIRMYGASQITRALRERT